ncbi:MAG TPA: DUF2971 domain-containing protein, partial [Phnomibacter sp.]|nr:DUF2971 domain-containing protein [Phnomibacter sp.]
KYADSLIISSHSDWLNEKVDVSKLISFADTMVAAKDFQMHYDAKVNLLENNHYGIISFSKKWDNILLWSHYSSNHTGFCVGFNHELLMKLPGFKGSGGDVIYSRDYPSYKPQEFSPIEEFFRSKHVKSIDWEYEREFRITKLFWPEIPTDQDRILRFPDDAIVEIILGLNIKKHEEREILKICEDRKYPVYKIFKVERMFQISRKKLNQF